MSITVVENAHRRITVLYIIGIVLFAASILGEMYLEYRIVRTEAMDAELINMSGRQRTLSQRIVSLAQEARFQTERGAPRSNPETLQALEHDIALMRDSHKEIIARLTSKKTGEIGDPQLREIYVTGPMPLDSRVWQFLNIAEFTFRSLSAPGEHPDTTFYLVTMRDSILQQLDRAVTVFAEIANDKLDLLNAVKNSRPVLLAMLIIFEVVVIFRPMAMGTRSIMLSMVAEKERARNARDERAEIASIADSAPQPIIVFDTSNSVSYRNTAALTLELPAIADDDLFTCLLGENFDDVLAGGVGLRREVDLQGRILNCMIEPDRIRMQIRVYIKDITDLKRAENQAIQSQKMETVGQLTGGIAHDFNNLLMVISGSQQLALGQAERLGVDGQRIAGLLKGAQEAALRGAALTKSLLAFSRRQNLAPSIVDVPDVIGEFMPLLKNAVGENVKVRWTKPEGVTLPIHVDPVHFESALLNIFVNARDAMPEGGNIFVDIEKMRVTSPHFLIHDQIEAGDYAVLSIRDTGTGMPREVARQVFEPFFTTKDVGKGSGLGLAMVWGFMKQSHAHVNLYSEEGMGTSVRMYFPLAHVDASDLNDEQHLAPVAMGSGQRVLLVDDDDELRQQVANMLSTLNYRVIEADNADTALRTLRREAGIDLVLTDLVMPASVSGRELRDAIEKEWPGVPVILMSGYPEEMSAETETNASLAKPYSKEQLSWAVRDSLARHAA